MLHYRDPLYVYACYATASAQPFGWGDAVISLVLGDNPEIKSKCYRVIPPPCWSPALLQNDSWVYLRVYRNPTWYTSVFTCTNLRCCLPEKPIDLLQSVFVIHRLEWGFNTEAAPVVTVVGTKECVRSSIRVVCSPLAWKTPTRDCAGKHTW